MRGRALTGVLFLLTGCHPEIEPTPEPFWTGLGPVALSPMRLLATEPIRAGAVREVVPLPETGQWAVLQESGVQVLDSRFHHGAGACVPVRLWAAEVGDRQGRCAAGEVWVDRGNLLPGGAVAGIAATPEALWLLDAAGGLHRASLDPLEPNPWDYLRLYPAEGAPVEEPELMAAAGGGVAVAAGGEVRTMSGAAPGDLKISYTGQALRMVESDGALWLLTTEGLWREDGAGGTQIPAEGLEISPQTGMAAIAGGAVLAEPGGGLWRADPAGLTLLAGPEVLPGLTGPVAADRLPETGAGAAAGVGWRIYLAAADGISVWSIGPDSGSDGSSDNGALTVWPMEPPSALSARAHRIVAAWPDRVDLYGDETALSGAAPLGVAINAFVERPRKDSDDVPCDGEESVAAFVARAQAQAAWLDGLPLPVALGVTPFAAQRIAECGEKQAFAGVWQGFWDAEAGQSDEGSLSTGILYHDVPEDCTGDCYIQFLEDEAAHLYRLGMAPEWISGVSPHADRGLDWVAGLVAGRVDGVPLPRRMLFPGMALLPEVDHDTDPRAKDPWPWDPALASAVRCFGSADGIEAEVAADGGGPAMLLPGDNVPVFSLEGCANLLLWECFAAGQGGGQTITEADTEVLQVLLFSALAAREDGTPGTWTFHLPDLGVFDYLAGCTGAGESLQGCSAAVLQGWALDVHRRYVLNGLAAPLHPADVSR